MAILVKSVTSHLDRAEQYLDLYNVRKAADTLETLKFTQDAVGQRLVEMFKRTASIAIDTNLPAVVMRMANSLVKCGVTPLEVATLYAKAGDLKQALAQFKEVIPADVELVLLGHIIDWNVAKRVHTTVPEDHRPAVEVFLRALKAYDAKDNAGAREALQAIGSTSPLMEWKLFLRGLLAWTENDDERANENFRRLNAERLPARLSAALSNPTLLAKAVPATGVINTLIQDWRTKIAKRQSFTPLFKKFKSVVPTLSAAEKALLPRLAKCYYAEIESRGEFEDMKVYKDLFGPPPLDPNFDRLEAVVLHRVDRLSQSQGHWHKYEAWVAKTTPWPKPINDVVRSIIKNQEGELAREALDEPKDLDLFEMMFRQMQVKKFSRAETAPDIELKKEDTTKFWLESHRLAPDWHQPLLNLLKNAQEASAKNLVVQLAEEFLVRQPEQDAIRNHLVDVYLSQKRFEDVVRLAKESVALNPLNEDHRSRLQLMSLYLVLSKLGQVPVKSLLETLPAPAPDDTLLDSTIVKFFRKALIERLAVPQETPARDPGFELLLAYQRHFLSILYKDKPAVKTKFKASFNEAVENETNPLVFVFALLLCEHMKSVGLKFTGQGVAEKQLGIGLTRRMNEETRIEMMENVLEVLLALKFNGKQIKTLYTNMAIKYPKNPLAQYAEFSFGFLHEKPRRITFRDDMRSQFLLKSLAESTNPKHQALIPQLKELIERFGLRNEDMYGDE